MSLTAGPVYQRLFDDAVAAQSTQKLWDLMCEPILKSDRPTLFAKIIELSVQQTLSLDPLFEIAEGFERVISGNKRYIKEHPKSQHSDGVRKNLNMALKKRDALTKEMRTEAGLEFLDKTLARMKKILECKEVTEHRYQLEEVVQLIQKIEISKSLPRKVRQTFKEVFPVVLEEITTASINKGDYETVFRLNNYKLGILARFNDPFYSAVSRAKRSVKQVLETRIELSISSGNWQDLMKLAGLSETSDLLREYIISRMGETVLTYVTGRIEYFQSNNINDGLDRIIRDVSEQLSQPVQVKGKYVVLFRMSDKVRDSIANLLVNNLEKVLAFDSSAQITGSANTAAKICVSGLCALGERYIDQHKEYIVRLLETSHGKPTETRKQEIAYFLCELERKAQQDRRSNFPSSSKYMELCRLAESAISRIRVAVDASKLKQPTGPGGNGIRQRV